MVVAATRDASYQNPDASNRLAMVERSDSTAYEMGVKAAGTPAGVQDLMSFCRPVVSSLALHQPLATGCEASVLFHMRYFKLFSFNKGR